MFDRKESAGKGTWRPEPAIKDIGGFVYMG